MQSETLFVGVRSGGLQVCGTACADAFEYGAYAVGATDGELPVQGGGADVQQGGLHSIFIPETEGRLVVGLDMDARVGVVVGAETACIEGIQLGLFHIAEVVGKVDDAGGICRVEGYAAFMNEGRHGR